MKLYQHLLAKKLGAIEKYFVIFKIIDILYLERRHADLPDHFAGRSPELNVVRRDQRLAQIGIIMLLRELMMRKIQIILINKTSVETFSFLVE